MSVQSPEPSSSPMTRGGISVDYTLAPEAESAVFAVVLACFKVLEEVAIGLYMGSPSPGVLPRSVAAPSRE